MMKQALEKYREEEDKEELKAKVANKELTEDDRKKIRVTAKDYFTNELHGDPADFNDTEFKKVVAKGGKKLNYQKDKKVEMKVSVDSTLAKEDLEETKTMLEEAIKESVNDPSVKGNGEKDE